MDRNGVSVFTVTAKETTPGRAKFTDWASSVLVICFLVVVLANFHEHQTPNESMILGAVFYGVLLLG